MSTVGGLSSSTTSSLRGYGGLASGLDRDELIESMTAATTAKIEKVEKQKTSLEWEQDILQDLIDKMYNFNSKYMSYSNSSTNLLSSAIYNNRTISSQGTNASKVTVTGNSSIIDSMSVAAVTQLATKASATFSTAASTQSLSTSLDLEAKTYYDTLGGTSFTLTYGNTDYEITIPAVTCGEEDDASSLAAKAAEAFQKAFDEISVSSDNKLGDYLKATASENGELTFSFNNAAGNDITFKSNATELLEKLGFVANGESGEFTLSSNGETMTSGVINANMLSEQKTGAEILSGSTITFAYNGTAKKITLAEDIESASDLVEDLQSKLDSAFGKNRIEVKYEDGELSFATKDTSSVLEITGAGTGILGENGVFSGINEGDSNRINLNATLFEAGLANVSGSASLTDEDTLEINGVKIDVSATDTISDIIDKINNSDANVTVSYLTEADRWSITSTLNGISGEINISGTIGKMLFGSDYTVKAGTDAEMWVDYGDGQLTKITRDTNSFSLNGMTFTLSGTFNADQIEEDASGATASLKEGAEAVTFQSTVNADNAVSTVKSMVEDINAIIDFVNTEVSTKPDSDYYPLTSDEESDLSESELEKWYEKAKEGLLFADSDLRSLASALRSITSGSYAALKAIGITTSTEYSDHGKLVLDEDALKSALQSDPDAVFQALAGSQTTDADGNATGSDGLMTRLSTVIKKYAGTTGATKGILVNRAGSSHAPTSVLSNSIQKQLDELDDQLDTLNDRLATEQDRYINQFTTLETLISQMNSQSSYISSFTG